jgi:hypothetical protein
MHGQQNIKVCQNDIKSLKINNTITNNPQEIAKTFNDCSLTVADTVFRNIKKKDNSDHRDDVNHSNYLINNFQAHFQELVGTMMQLMKLIRLSNP